MYVLPVSVYKKTFHNFHLQMFGPIPAAIKVYNSTGMNVVKSSLLYMHDSKKLSNHTLKITDFKRCTLLNSKDTFDLGLLIPRSNYNMLPKCQVNH